MTELNPCPYCGERGEVDDFYWMSEHKSEWYALCPGGCLSVKPCETEEEAVAAWNEAVEAINAYRRTCTVLNPRRPYGVEGLGVFGECSRCGGCIETTDKRSSPMDECLAHRFCPYCGAKVVGE